MHVMAELRFASGDMDRRRRMLAVEQHGTDYSAEMPDEAVQGEALSRDAFHLLSRDQMIRRVISPRLWKHIVVVAFLTALPLGLMVQTFFRTTTVAAAMDASNWHGPAAVNVFESLAGMELFIAGQLCLLICWVRSGSAVDYRGHYRTWRWLAGFLFTAAFLILSHGVELISSLLAQLMTPVLGSIESARPALFFVPAGAFAAFTLRYLLPDMGRCRAAQSFAVVASGLAVVRVFAGLRGPLRDQTEMLASVDLLIAGLTLSAAQLHCRYVIHINPNPPVRLFLPTLKIAQDVVADLSPPPAVVATTTLEPDKSEEEISDLVAIAQKPASQSPKASRKTTRKAG